MDCCPQVSSIHGILQARILEWVAISFSRGSSHPRDRTCISYVSCTGRQVLNHQLHLVQFSSVSQPCPTLWKPLIPKAGLLFTAAVSLLAWAAATSALSAAERSYPTSEVRGRIWEDPMPEGRRPRGVTPHPTSGAAAESARHRNDQEELPYVRGQGQQPRGATQRPRLGAVARRTYPTSEARGGSREDLPHAEARGRGRQEQPHLQGVVAAQGAGGPRGASPRSSSEGTVVRRYPLFKVSSSSCTLLEQP